MVKNPNTDTKKEESASKVSRMHVIEVSKSNLISLMGGKWTIYRLMGEEVIDKVIELLKSNTLFFILFISNLAQYGNLRMQHIGKSKTKKLKLLGSFMKDPNMQIIDRTPWLSYYINKLKH